MCLQMVIYKHGVIKFIGLGKELGYNIKPFMAFYGNRKNLIKRDYSSNSKTIY